MDQVRTRTTAKADKKGLKRRAGDYPLDATFETASVPLAVLTRRQWKWTKLCGALLAPPPALLGRR